ncbi:synembryn-A-like isoform X1 [Amblyraja radiata]|uniref:synembryn-A-like isoform X1 n=1 Tax=Amblyraja radiata TaxID=386614 RepID=UPI0014033374|nr:synembryn-A-like isoform X1 [Amblyraja radiata]
MEATGRSFGPPESTAPNSQCFMFDVEGREQRRRLAVLVLGLLDRDPQPSCRLACLGCLRILSRDRHSLRPLSSAWAVRTLARAAGIDGGEEPGEYWRCPGEEREGPVQPEAEHERRGPVLERRGPVLERYGPGEMWTRPGEPEPGGERQGPQEVTGEEREGPGVEREALKVLCNLVLSCPEARAPCADNGLTLGLCRRARQIGPDPGASFLQLRLLFLLTALRLDERRRLGLELHGLPLLTDLLQRTLGLEGAAAPGPEHPTLARQPAERAMEILKILFNITVDLNRRQVDEEDAAQYRHLATILRHCLLTAAEGEERTEELQSHAVNLLVNLPLRYLDALLPARVPPGSAEYLGLNMDALQTLLCFLDTRLDRGQRLPEALNPVLLLLTTSARAHRETRKFLRMRVLPPLREVRTRPETGNSLRNKLVRLMTHVDTGLKLRVAELLFVLCKGSVPRLVKYTGYGNAAGLLAIRGLQDPRADSADSSDTDSDTEEFKDAQADINPVTGRIEGRSLPPPMSEEQKQREAQKLFMDLERLARGRIIQPLSLSADGRLRPLEAMLRPLGEERESGSESD